MNTGPRGSEFLVFQPDLDYLPAGSMLLGRGQQEAKSLTAPSVGGPLAVRMCSERPGPAHI